MKTILIAMGLILIAGISHADRLKTVFNPFTGKLDYVNETAPDMVPGSDYSGFTFDGTNFCLYVNGVQKECWTEAAAVSGYVLLEDDSFLLLEGSGIMQVEQ